MTPHRKSEIHAPRTGPNRTNNESSLLGWIERTGNRLPDPATLFLIGTLVVIVASQLAVTFHWSVAKRSIADPVAPGGQALAEHFHATSLLSADGIWWLLSHLIENFITFPPLAIVLVGMLGIGLAERSGFLPALLRHLIARVPERLLTPCVVLLGIMSSIALDAGYVVLPPIAAALYLAAGRSPLAGIAAVFAGVSAGFSANLFITAIDPLLAGLTQAGAEVINPGYRVAVTANWWFMMASTIVLTLTGWAVTAWFVEPRLPQTAPEIRARNESPSYVPVSPAIEARGLSIAALSLTIALIIVVTLIVIPGAPLHGEGKHFPRWVEATVPLLFLLFFIPGIAYGISVRTVQSDKDVARMLGATMAGLGPYIVMAFFAAQFIESFKYSGLGGMLAMGGGQALAEAHVPTTLLLYGFLLLVMGTNLLIGSASAKYAFLAPVFVPMFMQVGISPELTQVAYRVGDSVTNVITPLNPYMIIILVQVQKYVRGSGLGTVVALMLPYALVFAFIWSVLLGVWLAMDLPLGPGGGLTYNPTQP